MSKLDPYAGFITCSVLLLIWGLFNLVAPGAKIRSLFSRKGTVETEPRWKLLLFRVLGGVSVALGAIWLGQMHPTVLVAENPLYDPYVHHWQALNKDGTPEEAAILERLERATQSYLKPDKPVSVPFGVCIGAVCEGKTFVFSAGRMKIDSDKSPDADTVFEIGSITKVFTGSALARCLEDGTVTLDQPLFSLLPGWVVPDDGRTVTLKNLATHHSGLPRDVGLPLIKILARHVTMKFVANYYYDLTIEHARNCLAHRHLSPRSYQYSNFGVGLLGYALANKCGEDYETMIERLICAPLGMSDTSVKASEEAGRAAQGYIGPVRFAGRYFLLRMPACTVADVYQGGINLHSTVNDLLRYIKANIEAPDGPIGQALARAQTPLANTDEKNCEIGMCLMIRHVNWMEVPLYWHMGSRGGFNACMAFSKEQEVGIVILASGFLTEDFGEELIKALVSSRRLH